MSEPQRTVFATLLASHRQRLKLTQAALAARTDALHRSGAAPRAITERTIAALEALTPELPRVPRLATVRSLAMALGLDPGTPDHDAFLAAARQPTAIHARPGAEPDAIFLSEGREPLLARLNAAVDSAALGSPSIMLLTGEAGSGKTRLLEEICRRALDQHDHAVVVWGDCPRGPGAMADHEPWRQILAQMLRDPIASDGPPPTSNAARLDARLPLVARALAGPAAALLGRLVPADALRQPNVSASLDADLARAVMSPSSPVPGSHLTRDNLDAAIMSVLESYASAGPLVIVLENLHWADDATRSALRHIASTLATRRLPIVVLGSIRTGDPSTERESTMLVNAITVRFPRAVLDLASTVGGEAGRAFVDAAVARLGLESLGDRLFERTGGQPLFVMSFLRLQAVDGAAIDGNGVPGELNGVFARQLTHLHRQSRALLAAASVQGDDFLAEPALAAAGIPLDQRVHFLDGELAGQVRFVGPQQIAPDTTMHHYRFTHALLHDYVTGTLSRLERSHLHLATADALERALGPRGHDAIDAIASHLEQGGDLPRAASAWLNAGDRAMLRSDPRHARAIFRHIRELGIEQVAPEIDVQAQVGIGNSLRALAHPAEARRVLQHAQREARRLQFHTIDANALVSLGVLDFDAGRMAAGAARFAEAIDAYTRAGELGEAARANANLSFAMHAMGRYDEARGRAEDGIALGTRCGDVAAVASAEIALSNCWLDLGYYEHAIARYQAALAHNDAHGLTHYGTICLLNIALCNIELGRWDDAEATLDLLDDPERRLVDRMRSVVAFNEALLMEGRGNTGAAQRGYEAARRIRAQLGQAPLLIDALAGLLRIAVATDDLTTTRELLTDIESRVGTHGTAGIEHLGRLHLTMVEGHRASGDDARAITWLSNAVELLRQRADRLADPAHRKSYLARPPANRRILVLARAHGLPVPEGSE